MRVEPLNRIKLLPDHIKHMIAAGEVVEAPFSVVKELVENSLDAGAREVAIEVLESGLKKIVVRDDGEGISRDDIALAVQEHATSKIRDISALENISTYGFRGEALSSIASISDLVILSRRDEEPVGARLQVSGGDTSAGDYAGPRGTTVIVENLFFSIPARKKFLKSRRTELRSIREVVIKMALAAYGTSFSLDVDGKRQLTLPAAANRDIRIEQVFGKNIMDELYFDTLSDLKAEISGYLSGPGFVRGSRNMQFFFVNGRPVEYRYYSYHLQRAYEAVIPKGKYPAAVLFLEIDPALIDVNIHPAKREIKLFDQRYIDSLVFGLAEKVLNRSHSVPEKLFKDPGVPDAEVSESGAEQSGHAPAGNSYSYSGRHEGHDSVYSGSLFGDSVSNIISDIRESPVTDGAVRILGVVFGTYILAQEDDRLHFVDFHAAHERILYDKIVRERSDAEVQELVFPVTMELPVDEYRLVLENIEAFQSFGFEVEDFSDSSILIRAVPSVAGKNNIESLIEQIIEDIKNEKEDYDLNERFASSLACHSAKRSGDRMTEADSGELVQKVLGGSIDLRCPHGRPFLYTINKNDLERIFKRL